MTFLDETIQVGSIEREYRLVVPKSVDGSTPAPVEYLEVSGQNH